MILAGFLLLAVGLADLVRQFVRVRWIGFAVAAILLLLIGGLSDALLPAAAGVLVGGLWVWTMRDRPSPATFWPAVGLGVLCVGAVVWGGERADAGLIGELWRLQSPFGDVSFDLAVLVVGLVAFLLESGNLVVRAALDGEHTWQPADVAPRVADEGSTEDIRSSEETPGVRASDPATDRRGGFKGGRLIGPLERVIVLLLTLAAAYPVLAAMLAAKGIVRFPEISRDGETGARAEYFLVGSLVSWVIALAAAFLVWWGVNT